MHSTLVAVRRDTGERLTIGDLPLRDLRMLSDAQQLACPYCGAALVLKAGPIKVHHFAHRSTCITTHSEPETEAHRQGKWLLYQQFRRDALAAEVERHFPETAQWADVYIARPDARYVLEFQQVDNTAADWDERHAQYQSLGLSDIWLLGQVRYKQAQSEPLRPISPYDPRPVPRDVYEAAAGAFRVRDLEKAILNSQDDNPRLYYLDPDDGQLTILLARDWRHNTLRAYHYRLPLEACTLRAGRLWTPLDADHSK